MPVLTLAPEPGEFDAAAEMRALAARLVAAHTADSGNPALARELRATLAALAPSGSGLDPELADLFAEYGRVLTRVLSVAGETMPVSIEVVPGRGHSLPRPGTEAGEHGHGYVA